MRPPSSSLPLPLPLLPLLLPLAACGAVGPAGPDAGPTDTSPTPDASPDSAPVPCEPPAAPLETLPVRTTDATYSLRDYTEECRAALGDIPTFNCYEGTEIPVTVTRDVPVTAAGDATGPGTTITVTRVEDLENGVACDRPFGISLASGNGLRGRDTSCVPFNRIGIKYSRDRAGNRTEFVFICRAYYFRTPDARGRVRFDDLGFIGHNPATGATCYWAVPINTNPPGAMTAPDTSFDGEAIPSPAEGGTFWKTFRGMAQSRCMSCHSNDPFISTPVVQAVGVLPSHPLGPYWAVAGDRLNALGGATSHWNQGQHLVSPEARTCTTCHRLTAGLVGSNLVPDAAGLAHGASTDATYTRVYPYAVWMNTFDHAELLRGYPTRAQWDAAFSDPATFVRTCADDPSSDGCAWADVNGPICCELPDASHRTLPPDDCASRGGSALADATVCARPTCR